MSFLRSRLIVATSLAMPRVLSYRLLALAAGARASAVPHALPALAAQPAAYMWSTATGSAGCDRFCACTRCTATPRSHPLGCGCGQCHAGSSLAACRSAVPPAGVRCFATVDSSQAQLDAINDRFAEAREEISIAHDDAETTYFDEAYSDAQKATSEVLKSYEDLLASLDESERGKLQRAMGMKMEQLKAEFAQLDKLHD